MRNIAFVILVFIGIILSQTIEPRAEHGLLYLDIAYIGLIFTGGGIAFAFVTKNTYKKAAAIIIPLLAAIILFSAASPKVGDGILVIVLVACLLLAGFITVTTKEDIESTNGEYYTEEEVEEGTEFKVVCVRSVNDTDEIFYLMIESGDEVYPLKASKASFKDGNSHAPMEDERYVKRQGKLVLVDEQ